MFAIPIISVLFIPALVKNLPDEHAKGAQIDGWGFTLIGAFAGAVTMFFTDMNLLWSVASIVTLVAFIVYINKAKDPFITPAFFKNPAFVATMVVIFVGYFFSYTLNAGVNAIGWMYLDLIGSCGVIRICGTVTVDEEETWELPSGVSIRRAEDFEDALVRVTGCLKLDNVRLYTEDITGDGEVEGAAEKEKVYVPKVITVKDTKALSEISLEGCDGDGVFSWEKEDAVPTEYETDYQVVFHPYDTKKIDYSKEKGWDEDSETVTRKVTVRVSSLKPEVTPTPEATDIPEVTPTPEATDTPEVTPTPEATPEVTVTPEPTTTPEVTPQPESTPQPTPEVTEPTDPGSEVTHPDTTITPDPTEVRMFRRNRKYRQWIRQNQRLRHQNHSRRYRLIPYQRHRQIQKAQKDPDLPGSR